MRDEHVMLRQSVRDFVAKEIEPGALERDRREHFDLQVFQKMGKLGLLGLTAPLTHGGAGMDALATVIVHEELSASDPGLCLAYLAHALLCVNNIAVNASDAQKERFLPPLCSGKWVGAMGLSEPEVGTDALNMKTFAKRDAQGNYVINGRKMWITNGAIDDKKTPGDCIYLYAKTGEKNGRPEISTFLIEKGFKGFFVGQNIHGKTGMRASITAELIFEDCHVPAQNRVGEEGDSLTHMMRNLEIERLGLAAMSLGIARRSIDVMVRYANERKAFGQALCQFGQIQAYIADSYAEYKACRAYVYETARRMDLHAGNNRVDSDGVKLVCAPMGKRVADRAMQVLGGYGYVSEYVVERLWRDAKLLEIGGGTIEAHQKNIAGDLSKHPNWVAA